VYLNKRPMSNVFKTKQIVRHFANSASKGFRAMSSIVYRPVRQKTRKDIWILGATLPFLFPLPAVQLSTAGSAPRENTCPERYPNSVCNRFLASKYSPSILLSLRSLLTVVPSGQLQFKPLAISRTHTAS